jgi:hypothetical protein
MTTPPLTGMQWPVVEPESALAKNATVLATSSGRTNRPICFRGTGVKIDDHPTPPRRKD